ncbi:MAG: putative 2OG-Fe(II) oxygenase [Dongiaceae bacterium]
MTLDIAITPEITLTFNVPVLIQNMPDAESVNSGLRRAILGRAAAGGGARKSNAGGWHSEETLLDWPEPEIGALKNWIDAAIQKLSRLPQRDNPGALRLAYRATGWANVNRAGNYNTLHVHSGSHWAVVYCVAVGEEEPGIQFNGMLELRDPRPGAVHGRLPGFMFGRALTIKPAPGLLVVFPAWIEHWVHPFHGRGERISIAVNVDVTKYEVDPPGGITRA